MKITILGSIAFRKEQVDIKNKLKELDHEGLICPDMEDLALGRNPELLRLVEEDHGKVKKERGYIKWYYNSIVASDAVLVLNLNKNGQENYIGGNVLMEIGFAHVHGKKIFLYNPVPEYFSYAEEIKAMYDEIINGDLSKIK
jgi:nucleoside 2-deoxyribosyltransferase